MADKEEFSKEAKESSGGSNSKSKGKDDSNSRANTEVEPVDDAEHDNICPVQEHAPLDHLLRCLPHKAQKGLFTMDLDYTCLDVSQEYVALGTSVSIVFLYDRLAMTLQKLKCQTHPEAVTAVRIRQSVDYVVAAGTATGKVFIFQLPSFLPGRAKQLHMFCVEDLHVGQITCLEWSPNTEKLFSGDQDGNVVCTEIDYIEHQSKSFTFCQEPHPVVQLSYAHRTLLVSTTFRSVLYPSGGEKKVKRIGTKDRKILSDFGACFMPGAFKPEDAVLYCARPGLRLWKATMEGTVATTYMFRDLLHGKTPRVPVLPDTLCEPIKSGGIEEFNFGKLYVLGNSEQLVTYCGSSVFILDPAGGRLLGWSNNLGEVQAMAVCGDEIFLLRRTSGNRRRIIRIAPNKDPITEPVAEPMESVPSQRLARSSTSSTGLPQSPVHLLQHTAEVMQSSIMAALHGVTEKIQEGQQLVGSPSVPPWGQRRTASTEDGEVDSCKEASSASSVTSSLHEELGSPGTDRPTSVLAPGSDSPDSGQAATSVTDRGSSSEPQAGSSFASSKMNTKQRSPQPEIHLDSDDVISVHIPHRENGQLESNAEAGGTKANGGDSSGCCSSSHGSGGGALTVTRASVIDKMTLLPAEDSDIVFSPKPKKYHKKKKPKTNRAKRLVEDTISIDSLEVDSVASVDSCNNSHNPSPVPDSEPTHDAEPEPDPSVEPEPATTVREVPMETTSDPVVPPRETSVDDTHVEPVLPPVQKLSDLGLGEIQICPEVKQSDNEQPKPKLPEIETIATEVKTDRPHSLPTVSSLSTESVGEPVLFGRTTSSPNRFEPFRPSYDRAASTHSTTDLDTSCITAANVSTSFHEDMNEASFESYARRNSEVEAPEDKTPSPKSERSHQFYQTPDSSDDFYSKYHNSTSNYSLDDIYSPTGPRTLEEALDYSADGSPGRASHSQKSTGNFHRLTEGANKGGLGELSVSGEETDALDVHHQFSDTWTEMLAPGNLQSMCLTNRYIWVVDKSDRLHYSALTGPGLTWRKVDEPARQIAVSRTGSIVWRLHQGSVYAGTKMTTRAPAGLNWVEVLRKDVSFIAVDDTMAWYIKTNGDVMMQKGLSRDRPSFRSLKVTTKLAIRQICCQDGVVWAVTEAQELVYRTGISPSMEEGTGWEKLQGWNTAQKVSNVSFGDEGTVWVIDTSARVWFTTGVDYSHPTGTGKWWEVSTSEYIMNDNPSTMTVRQMAEYPLSKLVAAPTDVGGLITAGQSGIWVSRGFKHVLHICRGSLLGHHWKVESPNGMAQSAQWRLVSASAATKTEGLIWTQQPNGAIFVFPPELCKATEVSQPRVDGTPFACLSAASESVWGLTKKGDVFIRDGMAAHCMHGLSWANLDLMQLGGVQLVYLSCGSQNVWAVDTSGMVFLRIGNRPPDNKHLSPAWVPVEGTTHQTGAKFTKVFTGSHDWMVWAVDSKKCVYVRKGVTDSMPIGTHWLYIPGTPGEELALSERLVYALSPTGELLIRYSVLEENPAGDFWKRVPGHFKSISVTAGDNLWGINMDGQLCQRTTHFLKRKETESNFTPSRSTSISDDWEVI